MEKELSGYSVSEITEFVGKETKSTYYALNVYKIRENLTLLRHFWRVLVWI